MAASSSTMRMLCMRGPARGGLRLLLRSQRYFDDEARAHGEILFHANGAVMVFDDAAHNGKSEAGSALLGRKIRQKKFFLQLGGDAVPGVGDDQLDRFATLDDGGGDVDLTYE